MGYSYRNNFLELLRAGLISSATVISAEENLSKDNKDKLICRPSELPIYCPDIPTPKCVTEEPTWLGAQLQEKISSVREAIAKVIFEAKAYEHVAEDYVRQGIDAADGMLVYLRQENSLAPKVGAIAIGGLTGFILSLRKGFFKKTLYVSSGALAMTAICYPKETAHYSQIGLDEGKKYANIAYNFAYGDKADSDNRCFNRETESEKEEEKGEEDESEEEVECHCFQNEDGSLVHDEHCPYV